MRRRESEGTDDREESVKKLTLKNFCNGLFTSSTVARMRDREMRGVRKRETRDWRWL